MKKNARKYNCSQSELYAVCLHAWESCLQNLDRFSAFKSKYSTEFVAARKEEVRRVSDLYDRYQRSAATERSRLALKRQVDQCLLAWRKLKTYISGAWEGQEEEACIKSSGQAYYNDAYQMKWESCMSLMSSADLFVRENSERLSANGNMDSSFPAEFTALSESFNAAYTDYLNSARQGEVATAEKTRANNGLYKEMMLLFTDAKMIFGKEPEILKQFVLESVLFLVSGQGSAGIRGSISNGRVPVSDIPDLLLILAENGDEAFVNEDGNYRFSQLAAGNYTMEVTATGYKSQLIPNIRVNTGAFSTMNITLESVGPEEGPEEK